MLIPDIIVPVVPKPTVESTDIIVSVVDTPDKTFVVGTTTKSFSEINTDEIDYN